MQANDLEFMETTLREDLARTGPTLPCRGPSVLIHTRHHDIRKAGVLQAFPVVEGIDACVSHALKVAANDGAGVPGGRWPLSYRRSAAFAARAKRERWKLASRTSSSESFRGS